MVRNTIKDIPISPGSIESSYIDLDSSLKNSDLFIKESSPYKNYLLGTSNSNKKTIDVNKSLNCLKRFNIKNTQENNSIENHLINNKLNNIKKLDKKILKTDSNYLSTDNTYKPIFTEEKKFKYKTLNKSKKNISETHNILLNNDKKNIIKIKQKSSLNRTEKKIFTSFILNKNNHNPNVQNVNIFVNKTYKDNINKNKNKIKLNMNKHFNSLKKNRNVNVMRSFEHKRIRNNYKIQNNNIYSKLNKSMKNDIMIKGTLKTLRQYTPKTIKLLYKNN